MKNKVGVMQGRLLNKYKGRYQAHPVGYWKDEFQSAQEIGLDCIEFILDFNDSIKNPLLTKEGLDQILDISEKTSVGVFTICADYFMDAPLHSKDLSVSEQSYKIFIRLLNNAYKLGVTDIVLPCVDQSSLNCQKAVERFVKKLHPLLELAEKNNINISLETDLAPEDFGALLNRFNSNRVTVNYDIGNSASLGFNPVEELDVYGEELQIFILRIGYLVKDQLSLAREMQTFLYSLRSLMSLTIKVHLLCKHIVMMKG